MTSIKQKRKNTKTKKIKQAKIKKQEKTKNNNLKKQAKTKKNNLKKQAKTKKNKYKKGGDINHLMDCVDETFFSDYESNIETIHHIMEDISGKHSINTTRSHLFIDNQVSDIRKQAAKDLIDNTTYITMKEIADIVEKLIIDFYSHLKENDNNDNSKPIYFYCGEKSKSYYFLSVLALHYIQKHNYKNPIFIKKLKNTFFDEIQDSPFLFLDDISYSGSQMSALLNNIYFTQVIEKKNTVPPNIFILLCALNDFSLNNLQKVPTKKTKTNIYLKFIHSPFHILYLKERLYKPLVEIIGPERYSYLNLFFSPFTDTQPYMSLYLDYKIADEASTYMKALMYGPIVPSNYNYRKLLKNNDGQLSFISTDYSNYDKTRSETYSIDSYIALDTFKEKDVITRETAELTFYPFIESCLTNPDLIEFINEDNVAKMNYICFLRSPDIENYSFEFTEDCQLNDAIHSYKCPKPFYKSPSMWINKV